MKISINVNKIEIFSSIALPTTTSKSILVTGEWRGREEGRSIIVV